MRAASLDGLPAAARLLLEAVMPGIDPVRAGSADAAVRVDDWFEFARLALNQKVLPLAYAKLKATCAEHVPDRVLAGMKQQVLASAQRNLLLTTELVSLLEAAGASGLPMLAFKGPVLATIAYGDLTRREFGDLDLLVRPSDVDLAAAWLADRGYRESTRLNLSWERTFVHDDRNIEVDLHWAFSPTEVGLFSAAFRYDLDGLWARRRSCRILNRDVATLGPEDTLITLCQNSTKDFFRSNWPRLSWFCDLAQVIRAEPEMDWRLVDRLSAQFGCRRVVNACIDATIDVFGMRIDRRVAASDRPTRLLAQDLRGRLLDNLSRAERMQEDLPLRERLRFHWLARERLTDRLLHLLRPRLIIRAYRHERAVMRRRRSSNQAM